MTVVVSTGVVVDWVLVSVLGVKVEVCIDVKVSVWVSVEIWVVCVVVEGPVVLWVVLSVVVDGSGVGQG